MAWLSPRTWTTSEIVTAAHMNQEIRDNLDAAFPHEESATSWAVALLGTTANPSGNWDGFQYRVGALMHVWGRFSINGNGTGTFYVELPVAAVDLTPSTAVGSGHAIGSWSARDDSAVIGAGGTVVLRSATEAGFLMAHADGGQRTVDDDTPWLWANGDVITMHAAYPVA